jgi:hypothetical protein
MDRLILIYFQKKDTPPKLQLKDYDKETKQSSWKTGLSHLLRRTKQSSMNNNVVTKQNASAPHNKLVKSRSKVGRRKEWNDMDAKWTATPASSSSSCVNSKFSEYSCQLVALSAVELVYM